MRTYIAILLCVLNSINLFAIDFEVNGIYYKSYANTNNCLVTCKERMKPTYSGDIVIPSYVEYDGITYKVVTIGQYAFYSSNQLSSVTIPNTVTLIDTYAFMGCSGLHKINLPETLKTINAGAFALCKNISSINIPSSVKSIANDAFYGSSGIESITVSSSNKYYDSRDNCNAVIEKSTNTLIFGCRNSIIPNTITTIGSYAFYDCEQLESITIPASVNNIENHAFEFCNNLYSITNLSKLPVPISENVFTKFGVLHVAKNVKNRYEEIDYWNKFIIIDDVDDPSYNVQNDKEIYLSQFSNIPAVLTFIDDDGYAEAGEAWESIYNEIGIAPTMALVTKNIVSTSTDYLKKEKMDSLRTLGFDFISHTHTHRDLSELTAEELSYEFTNSYKVLKENNCTPMHIVYPGNHYGNTTLSVIKDYFKSGCEIGKRINNRPLANYEMKRYNIANSNLLEQQVVKGIPCQKYCVQSHEYLRSIVDSALNQKGWAIIMCHFRNLTSDKYSWNESYKDAVKYLCQYAKSKGVKIMTYSKAFEIYKQELPEVVLDDYITLDETTLQNYENNICDKNCNVRYIREYENCDWQPLYVPFEIRVDNVLNDFDFAAINNFHQYDDDNDGLYDRTELEIRCVRAGQILQANYPYLIKSKKIGVKEMLVEGTTLYPTEEYSINCSSVEIKYEFVGSYNMINNLRQSGYYYMSDGILIKSYSSNETLPPFRWYLSMSPRESQFKNESIILSQMSVPLRVIEDDYLNTIAIDKMSTNNSIIFNLHGQRVNLTIPGMYIAKNNFGFCKKVLVK